jgi:hypothetical protein
MKWEYRIVHVATMRTERQILDEETALNVLGSEGWELLGPPSANGNYYLKRPLVTAPVSSPQANPPRKASAAAR